ncbi:hypothetical protein K474DRAFT_1633739 [Panus rudis PR-1116 ss-1]|nr:hypothetical protein K474DRAFT_1633739 [Panus rudis PR-1116 ss-1]
MDALQYDNYTSYSDASTPRTPSPRSDDLHPPFASPHHYKPQVDVHLARTMFDQHADDNAIVPETHALEAAHMWSHPYPSYPQPPGSRGSLLEELYENDVPEHTSLPQDVRPLENGPHYHDQHYHHPPGQWSNIPQTAHADHHHMQSHVPRHAHDVAMTRRATFPYVRQERPEVMSYPPHPFMHAPAEPDSLHSSPYSSRPCTVYGEPLPLDGSPHMAHMNHLDEPFAHQVPMGYDHIKTEESVAPVIVPSQTAFGRPSSAGMHPVPCLTSHANLLVQYTDDAASKETQYLRRRCYNCHTTEPPSWRRSTLNPGKIVCNKCGLYERTHLRPRPLRFDELRAGSKTRKQPKVGSPKAGGKLPSGMKKEPRDGEDGSPLIQRRSSVSSSAGSVHSGGATSDWDENVSIYSGSAPSSSFNSPAVSSFSIPRDPNSQSPPHGGIRLPNAPLSDIASLQHHPHHQTSSPLSNGGGSPLLNGNSSMPPTPRKAATAPTPYTTSSGLSSPQAAAAQLQGGAYFDRRGLTQSPQMAAAAVTASPQMQNAEVAGWQGNTNGNAPELKTKSRSNSLRESITAA